MSLLDQRCPGCGKPITRCPCCPELARGVPAVCMTCGEVMVWLDSETLGEISEEALARVCTPEQLRVVRSLQAGARFVEAGRRFEAEARELLGNRPLTTD